MSWQDDIETLLKADATVYGIVGARVYPLAAPQQTAAYPLLVYRATGGGALRGAAGPSALARWQFVVECYSTTAALVLTLANSVAACLDGYDSGAGLKIEGLPDKPDDEAGPEQEGASKYLYKETRAYLAWVSS